MVEGRLERPPAAPSATAAAPAPPAPPARPTGLAAVRVVVGILVARALLSLVLLLGGLAQLRLDLRFDLVAQVEVGIGLLALGVEAVALAEVL